MKSRKLIKSIVAAVAMTCLVNAVSVVTLAPRIVEAAGGMTFEPTIPKAVLADTLTPYMVNPGDTVEVVIPMRASNYSIRKPIIDIDLSKTSGFKLASDVTFYTKENESPKSITVFDTTFLKFSLYIPLNAKKGTYNDIPIKFITTDSFNEYTEVLLHQVSKLTFTVKEEKSLAKFDMVYAEVPEEVREDESFNLEFTFKNKGELIAKNVSATLSGYESLFRLAGSVPELKLGDIEAGKSETAIFELSGAKNLPTGLSQMMATVKYENEDGTAAEPQVFQVSVQTIAKEVKEPEKKEEERVIPLIQVVNVDYPRNTVGYGQHFEMEYTLKNTGKIDAKNVVIDITGYSEAGFKPDKAYDKKRVPLLKVGETAKMKIGLTAIDSIASGMKTVVANFTYYSASDKALAVQFTDSINTYIDAKGKEEKKEEQINDLNNSIPRLMISKYSTGEEKIMAGKIFDFSFDVLNTHEHAAADNIKATVSSADGSFSIVEGSASFYVSSLKSREVKNLTIPLKVKGDIATNGYDLSIKFDYEYLKKDPANNSITKQTTELTEVLKLQVFSNDRPMLSNIRVGEGELPRFMEPANLIFDFNNLGKSPLYNVTAKISGDFKPMNEVIIIGNVNAGEGKSWNMEVTPMVEMMGKGVLTISYEDSNGNVKSYDTNFESEVLPPDTRTPDIQDIPNMPMPIVKKDIMPLWVFVVIQVVVFFVAALIARSLIIKKYKKKKRAEIEREDEDL